MGREEKCGVVGRGGGEVHSVGSFGAGLPVFFDGGVNGEDEGFGLEFEFRG